MSHQVNRVVMVAAVAANGVIGAEGGIPWQISEDLKHFRRVTTGNTVVMGRTTYDGIGHPLANRTNIVVTRDPAWRAQGVLVASSVEAAIAQAQELDGDVMVIGGGHIYRDAMPLATHQVLTEVHQTPAGDTHYPDWDRAEWRETAREPHPDGDPAFDFVWWERLPIA